MNLWTKCAISWICRHLLEVYFKLYKENILVLEIGPLFSISTLSKLLVMCSDFYIFNFRKSWFEVGGLKTKYFLMIYDRWTVWLDTPAGYIINIITPQHTVCLAEQQAYQYATTFTVKRY